MCGESGTLANQPQQQVLSADVSVAEFVGSRYRLVEYHSRARGIGQIVVSAASRLGHPSPALPACLQLRRICAPRFSRTSMTSASSSASRPSRQMLGADVFVVPAMRFVARLDQGAAYPGREIVPCQKFLLVVGQKICFHG